MDVPTDPREASAWIRSNREARGWSTGTLAERAKAFAIADGSHLKLSQQLISGFEQPGAKRIPHWLRYVAMAFEQDAPKPSARELTVSATAENSVALRQVDLSYSMGPGANIDDYVEEGTLDFDASLLSRITRSPADRVFVASGAGDSMFPTMLDNDLVIVDTMQRTLNMQDRIWAISLYGAGAIKRLRAIGPDKVLVISDNKDVENQEVSAEDIYLLGRVVWLGRRL
ncbi:S24 family peptidase [Sphingomonas sp. SRS2]|uniref:S24 family peptidase n=1 Tax=Sphingomonas sp. SRS2 TaxID=133190 RepID=UPI000696BD0A|nr:LexA family transcriptional regulator [Sphingomonas sp. SRS2]